MIVFMREYRKNSLRFFSIFLVFFFLFILNIKQVNAVGYSPPELTAHDYYYFVGDNVTQEEILNGVQISDENFDINDIRNTLKITNWENLNTNVVGDYSLQITATNGGLDKNQNLVQEKYTGYLTVNIHVLNKNNQYTKGKIRYINKKYLSTLSENSNWFKNEVLTNKLNTSLNKDTEGENSEVLMTFHFTGSDIKDLKSYINEHGAKNIFKSDFNKLFYAKILAYKHEGNLSDNWIKIDGYWCYQYFDENNKATLYISCWKTIDGAKYYFDELGHLSQNKWQIIDDKLYYFTNDGSLAHGWTLINGKWYYFDENNQRVTGFFKINNDTYYFNENGIKLIGWQNIDGKQYYFGSDGVMIQDCIYSIDDISYVFSEDGTMAIGLTTYKGETYFVDLEQGILKNCIKNCDGNVYYFGAEGNALTGWQEVDGIHYYFDEDGIAQTGISKINDYIYYFDKDGKMLLNLWVEDYYFGNDGKAVNGIQQIQYSANDVNSIEEYYFEQNKVVKNAWKDVDNQNYYYMSDGRKAKNIILDINNNRYSFDSNGVYLKKDIQDGWYYNVEGVGEQLIKSYSITNDGTENVQVGILKDGRMIVAGTGNTTTYNSSELPDNLSEEEKVNYIIPPWLNDVYEDSDGTITPVKNIIKNVEFMNNKITPESLDYWFVGCNNLEEVNNIPTSVKSMYRTFDGAEKLTSIPDLNLLENLENIELSFKNCISLTKTPLLPNSVINMNYAFENNSSLQIISNIPNSVKYMNGTFFKDISLIESPDLPTSLLEMADIYNGCSNLKTSGIIPANVTILDRAYMNTTNLQGILYIEALTPTSFENIFKNSSIKNELIIYGIGTNSNEVVNMKNTADDTSKISLGSDIIVKSTTLKINDIYTPKIYINQNIELSFTSSNPLVASVDKNGIITALKAGTTSIEVKDANNRTTKFEIKVVE